MKETKRSKLIFVYNANSGKRNALIDSAHKILSPSTYSCSLCDITYGVFTENKVWKKFRESTSQQMEFLHKDEFAKQYDLKLRHGLELTFPVVLKQIGGDLEVFVKTEELNALDNSEDLIHLITEKRGVNVFSIIL